jgi:hypothetical protein
MPESRPIPFVVAMLVCDNAITEAGTNKKSLIGIFENIFSAEIPTAHGPFWIYAKLADAEGTYTPKVKLVHLEKEQVIVEIGLHPITIPDRAVAFELALPVPRLPFPFAGKYEFQLEMDGIFVGRTVFSVNVLDKRGPQ